MPPHCTGHLGWYLSTPSFVTGFLVSGIAYSMSGNIAKHPKARQLLTKLGRQALVPTKNKNGKWHKAKVSRRVAKVLRKESLRQGKYSIGTNDGWDPLWDKRRSNKVATAPRGHVHDNKIEERVQKVDDGLAQQEELLKAHRKAEADRKPKSFLEKILASD